MGNKDRQRTKRLKIERHLKQMEYRQIDNRNGYTENKMNLQRKEYKDRENRQIENIESLR